MRKKIFYIFLSIAFIFLPFFNSNINSQEVEIYTFTEPLQKDPVYKEFLNDIKKMNDPATFIDLENIPELKLAYYNINKRYDDVYSIAYYFNLTLDTIVFVNNLYSRFLFEGLKKLIIPNMDGGFIQVKDPNRIESEYGIKKEILLKINKIDSINEGDIIFIPKLKLTKLQKQFFLGSIFLDPLRGEGSISSLFGKRIDPVHGHLAFHGGIDLACPENKEVYPAYPGKVLFAGEKGDYGLLVVLVHDLGYETYYGHLSKINVKTGNKVGFNDIIGYTGSTGKSTGPHLHFEIRYNGERLNPLTLMFILNKK
ncbi:MAG: M23 family metallopeptidase [Spirochaetes bacterium]|nr:M23 family metallopeptidase [Spirochaetota bacterium]